MSKESDPIDYLRSIYHTDVLAHQALDHYDTGYMTRDEMLTALIRAKHGEIQARMAEEMRLRANLPFMIHVPVCGRCGAPAERIDDMRESAGGGE